MRGFCSDVRKEVFAAIESLVLIDSFTKTSIRALKVLLNAHLSIMKTYGCWAWMPFYFQHSHRNNICSCSLLSDDAIFVPLINDGLSLSMICLAEARGLGLFCSDPQRPAGSHRSWPQFGLIPPGVNMQRVNMRM